MSRFLLVDRVLSRHDEEGAWQLKGLVSDRHLTLLHRLEQRTLHLGRRTIYLIGKDKVGEYRSLLHAEGLRPLTVDLSTDDVSREKVGSELDPAKVGVNKLRKSLDRKGLRQSGDTLQEDVSVSK